MLEDQILEKLAHVAHEASFRGCVVIEYVACPFALSGFYIIKVRWEIIGAKMSI